MHSVFSRSVVEKVLSCTAVRGGDALRCVRQSRGLGSRSGCFIDLRGLLQILCAQYNLDHRIKSGEEVDHLTTHTQETSQTAPP